MLTNMQICVRNTFMFTYFRMIFIHSLFVNTACKINDGLTIYSGHLVIQLTHFTFSALFYLSLRAYHTTIAKRKCEYDKLIVENVYCFT